MKKAKKLLALLLATVVTVSAFTACGKKDSDEPSETTATGTNVSEKSDTPLVVGYSPFNSKFSPFFSETAYDQDVWAITSLTLLDNDRQGAIVMKGIDGETRSYNGKDYTYYGPADCTITENDDGTVYYDFKIKDGIKFSDGEPLTVDDVIFSMYVECDPTYDGSATLFSQPIEGMDAYRSGMEARVNLILAAGPDGYSANDNFTEEQYNDFWTAFTAGGEKFAQEILDYCIDNGYNAKEDSVATIAANWGYELAEDATVADFYTAIVDNWGYDLDAINAETAGTSISDFIAAELGDKWAEYQAGVATGESAASISGIKKISDNELRVVLTEVSATAIYQFALPIAPMHYYGDKSLYNYDNNQFGFPKGDLATVRAKTTTPMGAGPYKFVKFENGVVNFEANDNYYLGAPETKYVNFVQTQEADKLNGVTTGTIDITDPSFSADAVDAIQKANGGDINGKVVTCNTVDNLGYGYIGMNSNRICVDNDPGSDKSKDLRKGLATVIAAYRELGIESYYGERASVINYPISNTSWAAPQVTDADYKVAFSTDVEGNAIYTSGMSADDKYAAALQAALGYFEAAGCKVEDGKVVTNPAGGKDSDDYAVQYELQIPADGTGDHPAFMIVSEASKALKNIGVNLIVTDLSNSSELWTGITAGQVDMWCAAWGATPDPDMYQVYFSGDENNEPGGSNYMYKIDDKDLNQLILDARASLDQDYRKAVYKSCLDTIVDWAVEIPVYQRQNAIIFSTERVDLDSVLPDITTFYGWIKGIDKTKVK